MNVLLLHQDKKSLEMMSFCLESQMSLVVQETDSMRDDTGFPSGLTAVQITPLSSVFIVAHDLLDSMINQGAGFTLQKFLATSEKTDQAGTFKQIWKAFAQQPEMSSEGDQASSA